MDDPEDVEGNPTVGSSTIQVVDSSTPTDNMDMLLPEGSAMFDGTGVMMEDATLPASVDYMEPDQTDRSPYPSMHESSNNYVGSSGQPSSHPDDGSGPSQADDDMAASGQITSSSSRNGPHLRGGCNVEDSQSPQAVPEVDVSASKPSSSETDQVASSSVSADGTSINAARLDAVQSQVSSGDDDMVQNSAGPFSIDEESVPDAMSMQDGELQVVPDSGGSIVSKQPDTSTSWSSDAVTSGNSEQERCAEEQVCRMYPTTSEAQMVPVSSNTLSESREADIMSNSEHLSHESHYLSQQHEVSHSELEDDVIQMADTGQVHVTSSQNQSMSEALSSTEGRFGMLEDTLNEATISEIQGSHSGLNLLSHSEATHFSAAETNEVYADTPDSNKPLLVTCGEVDRDVMYPAHLSSQGDEVASSSAASHLMLPSLVSSNLNSLVEDEMEHVVFSSTDNVTNTSEATPTGDDNSSVAMQPDQSVPVEISNEARCTTPSQTDEARNLDCEDSGIDAADSEVAGPSESSQLITDSGMLSDSTVHSQSQAELGYSQTNNEAAHLENGIRYLCVPTTTESRMMAYLSHADEIAAEPDSGSAITEATGEELGPCDGGTTMNIDDEDDTVCADSPEQEYTVHLQNADSGSEEVTYLVQEGQDGAETFRIMTEQQLKEMQAEDTKVAAQVISTAQELAESSLQEQPVGQQFVVQAQMEGEEVLLHLPNVVQAAEGGESVGSHIITLDGHSAQEIQIIKSIAPQLSTAMASSHIVPSSSIVCRTDVERQTATVLSETLPARVVTDFQTDPSTSLLRPLTTAATVNTTSIRTPITAEVEAPSSSRLAMPTFNHQAVQSGVHQVVYQTQQELQPEFQIMPPGTVFPQVTQPGKSLLRPLISQPSFQSGMRVEPVIQAEVVYAEPREEIQLFNNVAYEPVPNTIQQALAAEGLLSSEELQPQPVMLAEGDLANHLTMAMAHGEIMQDEEYEAGIEIQDAAAPQVIDLGNTGGSAISADNMQALLQILQALPFNTQGQTVQIVLQGSNTTTSASPGQEIYQLSEYAAPQAQQKEQVLHLVQMMTNGSATPNKTMTDMAVQVGSHEASETILSGVSAFQNTHMLTTDSVRGKSSGRGGRRGARRPMGRPPSLMKNRAYSEPEDMGTDARSGVSYYAVIDYLSEQDGYSSSQDINHHEAPSSGFMEDHLELQSDTDGFQNRSLLESTLDLTTIVSPYRRKGRYKVLAISQPGTSIDLPSLPSQASVTLQEKSYEQAQLEGKNLSEQTYDDGDPTSRPPRYTRGLRTIQQKKPTHRCGYCDYQSRDKLLVMQHCEIEHPEDPIKTIILMPKYTRRQCPYCKQEFNYAEFFQHMRYTHNEVHPYKCYYCDFQGRDRNQVKHHIRKKHGKPTKIVNLLREPHESAGFGRRRIMAMSEGEESVYEYLTDEDDDDEWDDAMDRRSLTCPECKKTFKTLKYLKTHIKMHWPHRYQCGYCDYIATLEHQILKHSIRKHGSVEPKIISKELEPEKNPLVSRNIEDIMNKVFSLSMRKPRDPDIRKWARKWACPHCDYTCQFGASFRRHIRMHANLLPYKCNYCSFKGREKYYVRRHIARMHRGLPEIVVENTAENRACDTSSDEDFQAKGLRRRRRRRAKRVLKAVVPVETKSTLSDACMMIKHTTDTQPIREIIAMESRSLKRRALEELDTLTSLDYTHYRKNNGLENVEYSQVTALPPKHSDWLGEKPSFYYGSRDGEKAACKVCGQKIHTNMFYKHARKHFKVKPFKCGYCDYMAIERAKIRVHITFKHPLLEFKIEECHVWNLSPHDVSRVFVDTCEAQQWKPVDVTFTCPICQEQINGEECSLREHLYIHYDYKPYKCASCSMTFPSHEMAHTHLAVDHDQESETVLMNEDFPEEIESTIQQLLKEIEEAKIMEAIPHVPMKRKRGRPPKAEKTHNLFQCPICDRQLNCHTATIRRHFYSHYEYKPFQCGYCSFKATSDNEVKQHTASHGSVPCNIVFSEETMPPKLEKMLEKFLDAICLTPRPKQLSAPASPLTGSETVLRTEEGRRWKDLLTQGMCPWCNQKIGHFRPTAYRHLKHHFECHPFKCGHCDYKGVERLEIKQHIGESHPNCSIAIVGPTVDVGETEVGLRRFLWGKSYQKARVSSTQKDLPGNVASITRLGDNCESDKHFQATDIEQDTGSLPQLLEPLPANFRKGKPSRLIPRKESYHSDSEILEVKDTGATLLMRSFKSENEVSTDSSDSEDKQPSQQKLPIWADVDDVQIPEDFVVPQAFLQDVLYLLKISSLPHDNSMFKRKGDWHRCNQCRRRFRKYNALKQHIENDHAVEATSYFCCYCDYLHSEKGVVKSHIIDIHPGRRLLIKEKLNTSRSGSTKRRREEDLACIARVYREPKRARIEGEVEDAEGEEMVEGDHQNELEESVANIQHYIEQMDPPLKRKRGRPRKNPLPNMSTPLMEHLTVTKDDVGELVSASSTQESPKEVVVHVTVTQAYPPSRRRGRPRKFPLPVVTADAVSGNGDTFQPKESLPSTNLQTLTGSVVQIVSASTDSQLTPRKRGRPRKYPLPNTGDTAAATSRETTAVEDSRPQFVVVDKCIEEVMGSGRTSENEVEKSVAEASSSAIQDIVSVLESKDTLASQDSEADFEEVVLQLASDSAGEYKYKVRTKSGVEQETIRIFGSPPRIVRQKMSEAGEEEEEVLVGEDLEDLEECNENLPKILKMLRLRPSK